MAVHYEVQYQRLPGATRSWYIAGTYETREEAEYAHRGHPEYGRSPTRVISVPGPVERCETCGETFRDGQDRAEVYNPAAPGEGSRLIHAECIREGEEIA